jgi:long-chain fatty acid transport protein
MFLCVFSLPCHVYGGGIETYFVGARGKVMGGTLTGIADDPSSVFFNPAGLTSLTPGPIHWEVTVPAVLINYSYKDSHDNNKSYESEIPAIIPSVFLSKSFENNLSAGVGLYLPWGGGGVDYGETSATQPIKDGYLGLAAFTPAVAYEIISEVSVGIGFSCYYGMVEQTFVPGPEVREDFSGYAGYNAHFGILAKPTDQLNIGIFARTPTHIDLDGKSKIVGFFQQNASLEFTLPAKISLGLSYKPSTSMVYAANISYLFYDNFDTMTTTYESGQVVVTQTGFKNHIDAGIAIEYTGLEALNLRGSIRYSPSGTSQEYINAFSNDIDYILFDFGIGYKTASGLELLLNLGYNRGIDTSNSNGEYGAYQIFSILGVRTRY